MLLGHCPREKSAIVNRVTLTEFNSTLKNAAPPHGPPLLQALWRDAKGDWEAAHLIAQDVGGTDGAWVHAYLHRKEPDPSNAAYWYRRAGKPVAGGSFEEEWEAIAASLLTG